MALVVTQQGGKESGIKSSRFFHGSDPLIDDHVSWSGNCPEISSEELPDPDLGLTGLKHSRYIVSFLSLLCYFA